MMKKDARWVIREIKKRLPLNSGCVAYCECSADIVYILDKIEKKLTTPTSRRV